MQLPRKGLVVAHDQGWNVEMLNDVGHGERLPTARHADCFQAQVELLYSGNY